MPKQGAERRVKGGGGKSPPFRTVDSNYRKSLSNQISGIRLGLRNHLENSGVAPVQVSLISKALAKSHRPVQLFSENTCPIIGNGALGQVFIKATMEGLHQLEQKILTGTSEKIIKEISSVLSISPITSNFRLQGLESTQILQSSPRGENGFVSRVRLFDMGNADQQSAMVDKFLDVCRQRNLDVSQQGYSPKSYVYRVEYQHVEDVVALSNAISVRTVTSMPLVNVMQPKAFNEESLPELKAPDIANHDLPVVVVVDSGISDSVPELSKLTLGRETFVAPEYQNIDHGTFVAGLICWGSQLNPHLDDIGAEPCGVFDLQVLPNTDPNKGNVELISESEFLISLDTCLQKWANKYKVWNLSLGTNSICSLDEFSPLAEELDNLQEKYQVSFVISSGNYNSLPLLSYPRKGNQIERGRITAPADSVLGITVGSISHLNYNDSGPKLNCLSPFSRHGSGPNHVIKPDLVHYGGTCTDNFSHQSGIRSIYGENTAEDLGTSFAAPLVSRNLAQIYHQVTPTPSPVLARALLTHHARDPRSSDRVPDGEENFFGFGRPVEPPYCLQCDSHSSTLVFEDALRPGYFLEWNDFPFPPSLIKDGKYFGEVWMTVAFCPSRGARWGTEYCETHIDAKFGVYHSRISRKTGESKTLFKGLVPPEHKNPGILYESYQIESLRKWAPVRTYYGDLGKNGVRGLRWRLKLSLLTRHNIEQAETFRSQPFALIVTIADPKKRAPVYDEMSQILHNRFQSQNLTVRSPVTIRTGVSK